MKLLSRATTVVAVLLVALPVLAGQRSVPSKVGSMAPRTLARSSSGGRRSLSLIHGNAMGADHSPLPSARVQLRNLSTGRIEQMGNANYLGEFSFIADPGSLYVAELTDVAGRVLATGQIVTAQGGETVGTLVILPTRIPTIAGMFGNTAGGVLSAAAGSGITAVTTTAADASPEQ